MSNPDMNSNATDKIISQPSDNPSSHDNNKQFKDRLDRYYSQGITIVSLSASTGVILQPHMASWDKGILAWVICGLAGLILFLIGVIIEMS